MIELPEALTLARQIDREVCGKVIESGNCGNHPHKWAFYSGLKDRYPELLPDRTVAGAEAHGSLVHVRLDPGYVLALGDGGLRILLHEPGAKLPARYQLLLRFTDDACLTVSVQGWGMLHLLDAAEAAARAARQGVSPVSPEFTYAHFKALLDAYDRAGKDSVKKFLITSGGIPGIGNGYLQDILFRAGIHPRRKLADVTGTERRRLHGAIRRTLTEAAEAGGRDTERGLHGEPGRYVPLLDSRAKGRPCPQCAAAIEKISFLGGSCYYCPNCQT
jgi:formamidopyrimidine-DNA glycosylase